MSLYLCLALPPHYKNTSAVLTALSQRMQAYTPQLCFIQAHALLLKLQASLVLFGGHLALWRRIHTDLQAFNQNLSAPWQSALAPTAWGAYLLACAQPTHKRCLRLSTLQQRLDRLPINVLALSSQQSAWLADLACHSLAQLRQLPRAGLAQRGLPQLLQQLDQAYGLENSVFEWLRPAPYFTHRLELDFSTRHSATLIHALTQQIKLLTLWLQQQQLACDQLWLSLQHDHRHVAPTQLAIALSRSSYLPSDFMPVLSEKLASVALAKPVYAITLEVRHPHERSVRSASLLPDDPHTLQAQEQFLFDKLAARLGAHNLRYPQAQASHIPEQVNNWSSYTQQRLHSINSNNLTLQPLRPYWLLNPAIELTTLGHSPSLQGQALQLIQGPERVQSAWWQEQSHEARDYYIAQDPHHTRYWIYRLAKQADRWFLHGIFG